ncbi:MAG: hypothetical protein J6K66_00020 [Clostridia bacterium]|nr:hypothetical protein [Clostridia bacterium]
MKNNKLFFCLIIISVLLFTSSCSKSQQADQRNSDTDELYNYEVTEEPFESMQILKSYADYKTYNTEAEFFETSDIVFIGMPIETFTDGEEHYYNLDGIEISKNSSEKIGSYCTVRNIKVLKVLKGEWSEETIKIAEKAVCKTYEDGTERIIGLPDNSIITKKNSKYIYYANKAAQDNMDFYIARPDQGVINIDGLDTNSFSKVSTQRLSEVKSRFASDFAKYDRTDELAAK